MKDDESLLPTNGNGNIDVNDLVKNFAQGTQANDSKAFAEDFMASLNGEGLTECPICFSEMENPMVIPQCMHQLYVSLC